MMLPNQSLGQPPWAFAFRYYGSRLVSGGSAFR